MRSIIYYDISILTIGFICLFFGYFALKGFLKSRKLKRRKAEIGTPENMDERVELADIDKTLATLLGKNGFLIPGFLFCILAGLIVLFFAVV